jgi:hypothetical protein
MTPDMVDENGRLNDYGLDTAMRMLKSWLTAPDVDHLKIIMYGRDGRNRIIHFDTFRQYFGPGRVPGRAHKPYKKKPPVVLPADGIPDKLRPVADLLVKQCYRPAIYFLIREGVVVYVGSSASPERRVMQHALGTSKTTKKEFDGYLFYPVSLDDMLQQERNFVALLDPPINKYLKHNPFGTNVNNIESEDDCEDDETPAECPEQP